MNQADPRTAARGVAAIACLLAALLAAAPSRAESDADAAGPPVEATDADAVDESKDAAAAPSADTAEPDPGDPFDDDAAFEQEDPFVESESPEADDATADGAPLDGADLGAFFGSPGELQQQEAWPKRNSESLIEGIAAQVGSGVVLISEVDRLAAPVEERMRRAGATQGEILRVRAQVLDQLIESRLIEDVVRRAQLSATEAEVDQAIEAIARENGLTVEQMSMSIASHGLTLEEYRAKIKSELERNKVVSSMVRSRVHVDEKDVEELYEQRYSNQRQSGSELHLAHLLVATGTSQMRDERIACGLAERIREQIASGETDFASAARKYSDANAERGGDLGWVHTDDLAAWMAPAVENLEPGTVSDVIPMYFGCNLLYVVERRDFKPVTLDDVRPELQDLVYRQKVQEEYTAWIEKLRDTIYVERKGVNAEASRLGELTASQ